MKARLGLGLALAALAGIGLGYALRWQGERSVPPPPSPSVPPPPTPGSATRAGSDEELARRHCSGCHLFPEPDLLTRQQWLHFIMPAMALRLGIETPNYESLQEGRLLEAAHIYPTEPQVSAEDWFRIWDYYRTHAPLQPLTNKPPELQPLALFEPRRFSFHQGAPTICLVRIDAQAHRFYVGDSYAKLLAVVDPAGHILQRSPLPSGPVALARGTNGWYGALIGRVFPSDLPEGAIVWSGNPLGENELKPILTSLRRPTDVQVGDLNADGLEDLVVCQFGNQMGRLSWYENQGNQTFREHILLEQPGALRTSVGDLDGNSRPDILVLMAQAREGIYFFANEGAGNFKSQVLWERHPLYGYASMQVLDFNGDKLPDLLTVNGDNGDHPTPHKAYHGIRLHLNRGGLRFEEAFFYPLPGAYQVAGADFDQDGDMDLAAVSFYPEFDAPRPQNFVYLENMGDMRFLPRTFAGEGDGRWMTMDAGDVDGDGDIDLVLGAFAVGPTTVPVPEEVRARWRESQTAVLYLRNLKR